MSGANGNGADPLAAAIAHEAKLRDEASEIRSDSTELTVDLFMRLYPLLCTPIPAGFIQTIGATKGKPYNSTGIKSVQVQVDRMNNVLTPLWWWYEDSYSDDGKVATVEVFVGDPSKPMVLLSRSARGGVSQGSTVGNIFKGSFTNAGKLAFARIGPGHEVYLGAADLDPDVNQEVADQEPTNGKQQASKTTGQSNARVGLEIAGQLLERADEVPAAKENLRLAVSHILDKDIGDLSDPERALGALAELLNFEQAERVSRWIERKREEAEAEVASGA